jgi:hypothetical protein
MIAEEPRVEPGIEDLFKMMPTSPGRALGLPGHGFEVKLGTTGWNSKWDIENKANTPACAYRNIQVIVFIINKKRFQLTIPF